METFFSYYYPIRISLFLTFATAFFIKRKLLTHANFMIVILLLGILSSAFIMHSTEAHDMQRFPVNSILYCSLAVSCVGAYAINALLPGWLNPRRLLLLLIPPAIIFLILRFSYLSGVQFCFYSSSSECLRHANDFQVWIRFVMLGLLWIQFWTEVIIPHITIHHFKSPKWFTVYSVVYFIYIFTFGLTIFQDSMTMALVQSLYLTVFISVVCLLELFSHKLEYKRIKVTTHIQQDYQEFIEHVDKDDMDYLENQTDKFYKIEGLVMENEMYKKPNLSAKEVAFEAKLPLSKMNNALMTAGYASFSHFIAKCRVVALKTALLQNNGRNLLELYAQVGFSNRASASKYFKLFTGMTPTDWVKQEKRSLYQS